MKHRLSSSLRACLLPLAAGLLLVQGCSARVDVIPPPLFPPSFLAPGIGVFYYGGYPYYWDGARYSYWDGHHYRYWDGHRSGAYYGRSGYYYAPRPPGILRPPLPRPLVRGQRGAPRAGHGERRG